MVNYHSLLPTVHRVKVLRKTEKETEKNSKLLLIYMTPHLQTVPFTPINFPRLWDSNTIHHVQIDGELTEIGFLRRRNGLYHIYLHQFVTLFLQTEFPI